MLAELEGRRAGSEGRERTEGCVRRDRSEGYGSLDYLIRLGDRSRSTMVLVSYDIKKRGVGFLRIGKCDGLLPNRVGSCFWTSRM